MIRWFEKLNSFLGRFWTKMFSDRDFLLAVENVEALIGESREAMLYNWKERRVQKSDAARNERLPVCIDLDYTAMHKSYAAISDITTGAKTFGDYSGKAEWIIDDVVVDNVDWITDHVYNSNTVLIADIDYKVDTNRFIFYTDPTKLNLPTVSKTDTEGNLHIYYVLFGWKFGGIYGNDAVTGFLDKSLAACASEAWDVFVNGAGVMNTCELLAATTGGVVSETDGFVDDIWIEQESRHMLVSGVIYTAASDAMCRKAIGDQVKSGDILFGTMKLYKSGDTPTEAEVPSIRVMTDVGEMTAKNKSIDVASSPIYHDPSTGYNYLPLDGASATVAAYITRCKSIAADRQALFCDIPDIVNPFNFVRNVLRRRRGCLVTLTSDSITDVDPALDVVRKSTSAGSVVTVFIRATGESMTAAVSGFTAETGNAAVAEYATVKLVEQSAEARTLI